MIRKCLPYEPYQNYYACLGKYVEFDGRYFRGIDEPPHVAYETELKKKYGKNYKGLVMDGWFFKKLGVKYPTTAEECKKGLHKELKFNELPHDLSWELSQIEKEIRDGCTGDWEVGCRGCVHDCGSRAKEKFMEKYNIKKLSY